MTVDLVVVGQLEVNCHIVAERSGGEALVIDPGDEFEKIRDAIESLSVVPRHIVFTHAHYDHVCAAAELKEAYGASLIMHEEEERVYRATAEMCMAWGYEEEDFPPADQLVKEGDSIQLGGLRFAVMHTPGHTPGGICLYGGGTLFTGDTLFSGSVGRTDLPGGDTGRLQESLRRILALPDETVVRCGHGPETTLGRERSTNPFLRR